MIAAKARAVVHLAREVAEIIPLPPGGRRPDPSLYLAWEELMLDAAKGIAASVGNDQDVLDLAVGPELEVGVNPPWRFLLMLAQLEAETSNVSRLVTPMDQPRRRAQPGAVPAAGLSALG
jgi:hypothetical protein